MVMVIVKFTAGNVIVQFTPGNSYCLFSPNIWLLLLFSLPLGIVIVYFPPINGYRYCLVYR